MKKTKSIIAIFLILFLLSACSSRPKNMDETTYKLGTKALEIMDNYNNAEITEDEAKEQLDGIYDRLKARKFTDDEESQELQNELVLSTILHYKITLATKEHIYEVADSLREYLNK